MSFLPFPEDRRLAIGNQTLPVAVIGRGLFNQKTIVCSYDGTPRKWPIRIQERIDAVRIDKGTKAYDGKLYSLRSFSFSDYQTYGFPVERLTLNFSPTTYFEQVATDLSTDMLFKSGLFLNQNATVSPILHSSTILGLNLTLLTRDGRLVIVERSNQTMVARGRFHSSMGTNVPRLLEQPPDVFAAASNALNEELGLQVSPDQIEYRTFTVNEQGQYSLMGTLFISETRQDILRLRQKDLAHGWENKELHFLSVDDLGGITRFISNQWGKFFPVGLVAIFFSLLDLGYTLESIQAAFRN